MNLRRALYVCSIAAGVGVAGLFGTGIATANAAPTPGNTPFATSKEPTPQPGTDVKLDHHDRKKVAKQEKKELKHHPAQVTPTSKH
jgi:hypothetical protein